MYNKMRYEISIFILTVVVSTCGGKENRVLPLFDDQRVTSILSDADSSIYFNLTASILEIHHYCDGDVSSLPSEMFWLILKDKTVADILFIAEECKRANRIRAFNQFFREANAIKSDTSNERNLLTRFSSLNEFYDGDFDFEKALSGREYRELLEASRWMRRISHFEQKSHSFTKIDTLLVCDEAKFLDLWEGKSYADIIHMGNLARLKVSAFTKIEKEKLDATIAHLKKLNGNVLQSDSCGDKKTDSGKRKILTWGDIFEGNYRTEKESNED